MDSKNFPKRNQGRVTKRISIQTHDLLKYHYERNYSAKISRSLAAEFKRIVNDTPKYHRFTPKFVNDVRKRIVYLHEYNTEVAKIKLRYPWSTELFNFLKRYVELEYEVLYKEQYYSKNDEVLVGDRIWRLLHSIYYAFNSYIYEVPALARKQTSTGVFQLLLNVEPEYKRRNKLLRNMVAKLIEKLGILDKVNGLLDEHIPHPLDANLSNSNIKDIYETLADTDDYVTISDDDLSLDEQIATTLIPDDGEDIASISYLVSRRELLKSPVRNRKKTEPDEKPAIVDLDKSSILLNCSSLIDGDEIILLDDDEEDVKPVPASPHQLFEGPNFVRPLGRIAEQLAEIVISSDSEDEIEERVLNFNALNIKSELDKSPDVTNAEPLQHPNHESEKTSPENLETQTASLEETIEKSVDGTVAGATLDLDRYSNISDDLFDDHDDILQTDQKHPVIRTDTPLLDEPILTDEEIEGTLLKELDGGIISPVNLGESHWIIEQTLRFIEHEKRASPQTQISPRQSPNVTEENHENIVIAANLNELQDTNQNFSPISATSLDEEMSTFLPEKQDEIIRNNSETVDQLDENPPVQLTDENDEVAKLAETLTTNDLAVVSEGNEETKSNPGASLEPLVETVAERGNSFTANVPRKLIDIDLEDDLSLSDDDEDDFVDVKNFSDVSSDQIPDDLNSKSEPVATATSQDLTENEEETPSNITQIGSVTWIYANESLTNLTEDTITEVAYEEVVSPLSDSPNCDHQVILEAYEEEVVYDEAVPIVADKTIEVPVPIDNFATPVTEEEVKGVEKTSEIRQEIGVLYENEEEEPQFQKVCEENGEISPEIEEISAEKVTPDLKGNDDLPTEPEPEVLEQVFTFSEAALETEVQTVEETVVDAPEDNEEELSLEARHNDDLKSSTEDPTFTFEGVDVQIEEAAFVSEEILAENVEEQSENILERNFETSLDASLQKAKEERLLKVLVEEKLAETTSEKTVEDASEQQDKTEAGAKVTLFKDRHFEVLAEEKLAETTLEKTVEGASEQKDKIEAGAEVTVTEVIEETVKEPLDQQDKTEAGAKINILKKDRPFEVLTGEAVAEVIEETVEEPFDQQGKTESLSADIDATLLPTSEGENGLLLLSNLASQRKKKTVRKPVDQQNKRILRSSVHRAFVPPRPNDYTTPTTSTVSNKVYSQYVNSDHNVTSEDSNDSGTNFLIDLGSEDTSEEILVFRSNSVKSPVEEAIKNMDRIKNKAERKIYDRQSGLYVSLEKLPNNLEQIKKNVLRSKSCEAMEVEKVKNSLRRASVDFANLTNRRNEGLPDVIFEMSEEFDLGGNKVLDVIEEDSNIVKAEELKLPRQKQSKRKRTFQMKEEVKEAKMSYDPEEKSVKEPLKLAEVQEEETVAKTEFVPANDVSSKSSIEVPCRSTKSKKKQEPNENSQTPKDSSTKTKTSQISTKCGSKNRSSSDTSSEDEKFRRRSKSAVKKERKSRHDKSEKPLVESRRQNKERSSSRSSEKSFKKGKSSTIKISSPNIVDGKNPKDILKINREEDTSNSSMTGDEKISKKSETSVPQPSKSPDALEIVTDEFKWDKQANEETVKKFEVLEALKLKKTEPSSSSPKRDKSKADKKVEQTSDLSKKQKKLKHKLKESDFDKFSSYLQGEIATTNQEIPEVPKDEENKGLKPDLQTTENKLTSSRNQESLETLEVKPKERKPKSFKIRLKETEEEFLDSSETLEVKSKKEKTKSFKNDSKKQESLELLKSKNKKEKNKSSKTNLQNAEDKPASSIIEETLVTLKSNEESSNRDSKDQESLEDLKCTKLKVGRTKSTKTCLQNFEEDSLESKAKEEKTKSSKTDLKIAEEKSTSPKKDKPVETLELKSREEKTLLSVKIDSKEPKLLASKEEIIKTSLQNPKESLESKTKEDKATSSKDSKHQESLEYATKKERTKKTGLSSVEKKTASSKKESLETLKLQEEKSKSSKIDSTNQEECARKKEKIEKFNKDVQNPEDTSCDFSKKQEESLETFAFKSKKEKAKNFKNLESMEALEGTSKKGSTKNLKTDLQNVNETSSRPFKKQEASENLLEFKSKEKKIEIVNADTKNLKATLQNPNEFSDASKKPEPLEFKTKDEKEKNKRSKSNTKNQEPLETLDNKTIKQRTKSGKTNLESFEEKSSTSSKKQESLDLKSKEKTESSKTDFQKTKEKPIRESKTATVEFQCEENYSKSHVKTSLQKTEDMFSNKEGDGILLKKSEDLKTVEKDTKIVDNKSPKKDKKKVKKTSEVLDYCSQLLTSTTEDTRIDNKLIVKEPQMENALASIQQTPSAVIAHAENPNSPIDLSEKSLRKRKMSNEVLETTNEITGMSPSTLSKKCKIDKTQEKQKLEKSPSKNLAAIITNLRNHLEEDKIIDAVLRSEQIPEEDTKIMETVVEEVQSNKTSCEIDETLEIPPRLPEIPPRLPEIITEPTREVAEFSTKGLDDFSTDNQMVDANKILAEITTETVNEVPATFLNDTLEETGHILLPEVISELQEVVIDPSASGDDLKTLEFASTSTSDAFVCGPLFAKPIVEENVTITSKQPDYFDKKTESASFPSTSSGSSSAANHIETFGNLLNSDNYSLQTVNAELPTVVPGVSDNSPTESRHEFDSNTDHTYMSVGGPLLSVRSEENNILATSFTSSTIANISDLKEFPLGENPLPFPQDNLDDIPSTFGGSQDDYSLTSPLSLNDDTNVGIIEDDLGMFVRKDSSDSINSATNLAINNLMMLSRARNSLEAANPEDQGNYRLLDDMFEHNVSSSESSSKETDTSGLDSEVVDANSTWSQLYDQQQNQKVVVQSVEQYSTPTNHLSQDDLMNVNFFNSEEEVVGLPTSPLKTPEVPAFKRKTKQAQHFDTVPKSLDSTPKSSLSTPKSNTHTPNFSSDNTKPTASFSKTTDTFPRKQTRVLPPVKVIKDTSPDATSSSAPFLTKPTPKILLDVPSVEGQNKKLSDIQNFAREISKQCAEQVALREQRKGPQPPCEPKTSLSNTSWPILKVRPRNELLMAPSVDTPPPLELKPVAVKPPRRAHVPKAHSIANILKEKAGKPPEVASLSGQKNNERASTSVAHHEQSVKRKYDDNGYYGDGRKVKRVESRDGGGGKSSGGSSRGDRHFSDGRSSVGVPDSGASGKNRHSSQSYPYRKDYPPPQSDRGALGSSQPRPYPYHSQSNSSSSTYYHHRRNSQQNSRSPEIRRQVLDEKKKQEAIHQLKTSFLPSLYRPMDRIMSEEEKAAACLTLHKPVMNPKLPKKNSSDTDWRSHVEGLVDNPNVFSGPQFVGSSRSRPDKKPKNKY